MARAAQDLCASCGKAILPGSRFCNNCGAPMSSLEDRDDDAALRPLAPGDVLEGKWRIDKKLGQGGMGAVYLATDLALQRKVAIKVLAAELCGDAEFSARFEREARLTANLDHPNVVMVFGVGSHLGQPFIVMKYIEGETLSRRLTQQMRGRMSGLEFGEVLTIAEQLCSGLGYIHSKGFVHRDIKTGNIIIGPDGRATILDFGILRDTRARDQLTKVGVMLGTPVYVSPEQILGKKADHRADLYALGIMIYELLTGVPPFDGENDYQIIEMHIRQAPPDPCRNLPELPHEVCQVLARALAKKPEERYQSAAELQEALVEAFGHAGVRRRPVPQRRRTSAALAAAPEAEHEGEEVPTTQVITGPRSGGASRLGAWGAILAVILVSIAVVAGALLQTPEPPPVARTKPARVAAPSRPKPVEPVAKQAEPEEQLGEDEEWEYYDEEEEAAADAGAAASPAPEAETGTGRSLLKRAAEAQPDRLDSVITGRDARGESLH